MTGEETTDEAFPLEDLVGLPEHYGPVVAPDGERVAFYYDETGRTELYVQDLPSGERERISDGNVPRDVTQLAWSADGERIYFHEDDGGDEQFDVHAMTLDGEREPLITHEGQCVLEDVGPHGDHLLFTSTAGQQKNLYRYDLAAGESEQLTDYEQPVWSAIYGPDGDRIAYRANETDDLENRDVYVADADGSNARNLGIGETGAESGMADWAGDRLLVDDNSEDLGRVGVYDLDADEAAWYGAGDHEEMAVRFTPGGDVLAMRTRDCAIMPVRYRGPDDDGEEFDLPEGVATPVGAGTSRVHTHDGRVVTSFGTADGRRQLVAYDLESGEHEPIVAAEYGDFDPDEFVDAEYVTYESHDGLEIDGLLYDSGERRESEALPSSRARSARERPSPAVVKVHGGPHGMALRRFQPLVQTLVARGYSVLSPNYRGSMGQGRTFKNMVHGDWGGDEQGDIAEAGRWLAEQDWVDEDRLAVVGASYGGYSAYCQLTSYPERWATGVAVVGMTDLQLLYEESMPHFKSTLEEQLGDPEENAAFYRERSPITHVDDVERPICIVHGVNDPRCPVSQARVFRDALEERGWEAGEDDVTPPESREDGDSEARSASDRSSGQRPRGEAVEGDFEYHELGEEGHGSTDTDQRIRQNRILVDYVERRL